MTLKKTYARLASAGVACLMLAAQFVAPLSVGATPTHKIDICHGTASYSNPYTKNNVDKSAADGISGNNNGNGDHYSEHQGPIFYTTIPQHTEWGDIIPPVKDAQGNTIHNGLNWTTEGQAIYNNNCNFPKGEIEVDKKVDADGNGVYEGGNTTANNLGFRWGFDGETPNRLMGDDADALAGTHTVTEKMVNGYVFTGWYYTGDTQYSCSNPRGTTLPVQVDVTKNQTKKVTFCNQAKNGNITIIKDAQPNDGQDFAFEIDKVSSSWDEDFTLDDDGNNANTRSNTKSFNDLLAGTYVVTENSVSGWNLADITCSAGSTVVVDKANRKVTITIDHNDAVTCTFVNQKKGTLKVYKHTVPAGDQTQFGITATGTGTIYGNANRTIADGEWELYDVAQGTYSVSEPSLPAGWTQSSNTCANVVVDQNNLHATCHITNTKQAKLTIKKEARPSHEQDFNFTSTEVGNFVLDDDADATLSDEKVFTGLLAGDVTVTEQQIAGWSLQYIVCSGTNDYVTSTATGELTVTLKAGDNVICTFGNDKYSSVDGYKFDDLNNNGAWDNGEPTLEGWTITLTKECWQDARCANTSASTQTDQDGYYRFEDLTPGDYEVCETQQAGWTQTYPQTDDGCHEFTVEYPGTDVSADFGNFKLGQVSGAKFNDVNGNGAWDNGEPTLSNWTISLYNGHGHTVLNNLSKPTHTAKTDQNGKYSFSDLAPGDYTVCETQQGAWTRTYPATSDCHEFSITTSGQIVTANFGNKPKPQILAATTSTPTVTPTVLAATGAEASKQIAVGLLILSVLGAIHFMTNRRKDYAK